jgi:hypothetical protein
MSESNGKHTSSSVMRELAGIEAEISRRAEPPAPRPLATATEERPASADLGSEAASTAAAHAGENGGARISEIEESLRSLDAAVDHVAENAKEFARLDGAADWAAFARVNATQTAASIGRLSEAADRGGQPVLAAALRSLVTNINRIERSLGGGK